MDYDVVYSDKAVNVADIIHQALDKLVAQQYQLTYNGQTITDRLLITFPSLANNAGGISSNICLAI